MKNCSRLEHCLCCTNRSLKIILDLGKQPLANSYSKDLIQSESYPLSLNLCTVCYHLQLTHVVNPDIIYRNYLYVAGTNQTIKKYINWFGNLCLSYFDHMPNGIIDIGCNDGSQLDFFKEKNIPTVGIDPALNLYEKSSKKHHIIPEFFTAKTIKKIKQPYDIIIAQNVFAHNPDPYNFLVMCDQILSSRGRLFIQTSQSDMIVNREFDTIYHEHINFFNTQSIKTLIDRTNLKLLDVLKSDIHGKSYIFILGKSNSVSQSVEALIQEERNNRLYEESTYHVWRQDILSNMEEFKQSLSYYKNLNYKIIGYGAAAKGNTIINFLNLDINYIIDDNPLKQNLCTPGKLIEISSSDRLREEQAEKILFVPLAWNFFDEIKFKIKQLRNSDKDIFIKYFPKVNISV